MGRLAGFAYKKITSKLSNLGFEFRRQAAGSHEIWSNPLTGNRPDHALQLGHLRQLTQRKKNHEQITSQLNSKSSASRLR